MQNLFRISSLLLVVLFLDGCHAAIVSGATTTSMAVAEERSVGNVIDDATIKAQIKSNYLQKDIDYLFTMVGVDVKEGRVLLTGSVDDPDTRVEAVRLAWLPRGVKEVINEIQVTGHRNLSTYSRDTWITTQVKSKLLLNTEIRSINYSVETVNGIVYLMGIAHDKREMDDVTYIASRIKGVDQVISHIRMKDDPLRN